MIVSDAFLRDTAKVGFEYADGVDGTTVPQTRITSPPLWRST